MRSTTAAMALKITSYHLDQDCIPAGAWRISARKEVRAPAATLYEFLATLDNHWLLTDRFVSLVRLHGPVDSRTGGEIAICGPWGLRRHARTWLDADDRGLRLVGTAAVGQRTLARVTWTLTPAPGGTEVELTAAILAASPFDRALLLVAAPWLRRRFMTAIERLEEHAVLQPRREPVARAAEPPAA